MDGVLSVPAMIVFATVCAAACTDLWTFKVPNVLTLPLLVGGVIYHSASSGRIGFQDSIAGALVAFAVLLLPYIAGGMGAGDVKLVTGVGAWVGVPVIIYVLLVSCLAAGTYAMILMLLYGRAPGPWCSFRRKLSRHDESGGPAEQAVEAATQRDDRRRRLVPFAAMVAIGVLANLIWR